MADHTSHSGASFADSLSRPQSPSMLYSMIPSAVKSRLPKLPSIRRSASMYGLKPRPKSADSSCPSSGSTTPRTILGSSMVWSGARAEGELYFAGGIEASEDEDATQVDKRNFQQHEVLDETRSGIGWKFANQGTYYLLCYSYAPLTVCKHRHEPPLSRCRRIYLNITGSKIGK